MDNITHSLVGVALADAIMGRRATKAQRPLVAGAGLIAANLPDIDLAYSAITPAPLGYLLHHRGHTHTVAGLVALMLLLGLAYFRMPAVRAMGGGARLRFWCVMAVALTSHLAIDALNSYGVHPWYPVDNDWYFGDAVFIFEPSLWLILGIAMAWNGRSGVTRFLAAAPTVLLIAATAFMGIIPVESLVVLGMMGGLFAWMARRMSPQGRAAFALGVATVVVSALLTVSRVARAEAREVLRPHLEGRLVDVVLTPSPSAPLCWSLIGIELDEARGEYVLWLGTLSLAPGLKAPASCALQRLVESAEARPIGDGRVVLSAKASQSLPRLRDLARRNCWVAAWLRFGRVPVIDGGQIFDVRFGERGPRAFTHMPLDREPGEPSCPRFVPAWEMPRRDLLGR